jgi:hypothetical protein
MVTLALSEFTFGKVNVVVALEVLRHAKEMSYFAGRFLK